VKHSITVKFLAFILCALSLVTVVFSGFGIGFMQAYDLYHTPLETIRQNQMNYASLTLAEYYAQWHAAESLSNVPYSLLSEIFDSYYINNMGNQYVVEIYEDGKQVYHINTVDDLKGEHFEFTYTITPEYPILTDQIPAEDSVPIVAEPTIAATTTPHTEPPADAETTAITAPTEDPAGQTETVAPTEEAVDYGLSTAAAEPVRPSYEEAMAHVAGQKPLYSQELYDYYVDEYGYGRQQGCTVDYYEGPAYDVHVVLSSQTIMDADYMLVSVLYPYRDYYIPLILGALVIFIVTLVFLLAVAGRRAKGEIHLAAINRIPLDLYALCCAGLSIGLAVPVVWLFESALYESAINIWDNPRLCLLICGLCGFGISSLVIGYLYAFAAQSKAPDNYWLRHSCIGWCFSTVGKAIRWVGRGIAYVFRGSRAVVRMLPIIWQWLLTAFGMVIIPFLLFLLCINSFGFGEFFWGMLLFAAILADVALVCYGAWCFGILLKGARKMAQGNLNYQIDTRYLLGCFRDFAQQLNALAGAAQIAAERQMKSERMKAELITNVSHDIKTPLTSIINYVDLLKKPHSEEDGQQYLEVLDRQSQRLKKLIGDLMDMSKASSGNVAVEITEVDAVEAVNQALGEFADKLEKVNLTPIFRHPQDPVLMQADGKLVWRVLSNLLSNAVKYALPDTRLYVDLMVLQGNAVLAIKNISRDQLNVNADELMERFVRGDTSRNTEGSGLGLNIAKNLVELQNGQMHLMVDGDLFKVTLIFPLV
jgi:signal transduction histidine kinase